MLGRGVDSRIALFDSWRPDPILQLSRLGKEGSLVDFASDWSGSAKPSPLLPKEHPELLDVLGGMADQVGEQPASGIPAAISAPCRGHIVICGGEAAK